MIAPLSPSTGKRERPLSRAASMTAAIESSSATVTTRPRGVMISCAVRSPNASERCSSAAVPRSSVPVSAERRTSEASSSAERADASSSCGSMPIRRRIAFAVSLRTRIDQAGGRA